MIVLHQFMPAFGCINASLFGLKVEAWLRLAAVPYRVEPIFDPSTAPKGKSPFIEDGAQRVGDSAFIIQHLQATRGIDLDRQLTPQQRGIGRAIAAMIEDRLYFVILYRRWIEPDGWPFVRDAYFAQLPEDDQVSIQNDQRRRIKGHGLGAHSCDEIHAVGIADIDALADILGDQPFFMGEKPTLVDCAAFAAVHNMLTPQFGGPLLEAARSHENLVAYERRFQWQVFPEFARAHAA